MLSVFTKDGFIIITVAQAVGIIAGIKVTFVAAVVVIIVTVVVVIMQAFN